MHGGTTMGYYAQRLSTIFKGTTVLGFKQRWNARKIVKRLSNEDKIIFTKLPQEVEKDHKVSQAIRDIEKVLNDDKIGVKALNKFLIDTEFQEDNFDKAIRSFGDSLDVIAFSKEHRPIVIGLMESSIKMLRLDEDQDRSEYKDVAAFINAAAKGQLQLRNMIKLRFKDVQHETLLERIAIRFETKDVTSAIDNLNLYAERLPSLKSEDQKIEMIRKASEAIKKGVKELNDIKKRSFLWVSKMLYDMILIEELLMGYTKKHYIPVRVAEGADMKIQEIIKGLLKEMTVIAQAFRIQIKNIEENIEKLQRKERSLASQR